MKKSNIIQNIIRKEIYNVLNEQIIGTTTPPFMNKTVTPAPYWKNADALHSNVNRDLEKAKKYWRKYINSPVIAARWQKAWGKSESEWIKVKKGYLRIIRLAHVSPAGSYEIAEKQYAGVHYDGKFREVKYTLKHTPDADFTAYVKSRSKKIPDKKQTQIYVQLFHHKTISDAYELRTYKKNMAAVMVHEIQHLLYYYHPLSPPDKINKSFPGGDRNKKGPSGLVHKNPFTTNKDLKKLAKLTREFLFISQPGVKLKMQRTYDKVKNKEKLNPKQVQLYDDWLEVNILYKTHYNKYFKPIIEEMKKFDKAAGYTPKYAKNNNRYYFKVFCYWIRMSSNDCSYACDQNEKISDIAAARYLKYYKKKGTVTDNIIKPIEFSKTFHESWPPGPSETGLWQEIKCWACNGFNPSLWEIMSNLNQLVKNKATGDELGDKTQTMA